MIKKFSVIFFIFMLLYSSSISVIGNNEISEYRTNQNERMIIYIFQIGSIYNLTYYDFSEENFTIKGYGFQCNFLFRFEIVIPGGINYHFLTDGDYVQLLEGSFEYRNDKYEMYY